MTEFMNVNQAAKMAGCSLSTIRRWLKQGRIEGALKREDGWHIPMSHLQDFLADATPQVGALRVAARSPTEASDRLIAQLEKQLEMAQQRAEKLEEEKRELHEENRQLHAEIRALLEQKSSSKLGQMISRWVRV